jgi:hypothetical protein
MMKNVSLKKRELVDAIAYQHHMDFNSKEWLWEVSLNLKATRPEAHVVFVDYTATTAVPFYVGEENYPIEAFSELDRTFRWGDPGSLDLGQPGDGKGLEAICIPDTVRSQVEGSLRKHVTLAGNSYSINYY